MSADHRNTDFLRALIAERSRLRIEIAGHLGSRGYYLHGDGASATQAAVYQAKADADQATLDVLDALYAKLGGGK